jgi:hypothetical protein
MYCTKCGGEIITQEPFCLFCGHDFSGPEPVSFEVKTANQQQDAAESQQKALIAYNLRRKRRSYISSLLAATFVVSLGAGFFLLAVTGPNPWPVAERHITETQYVIIVIAAALALWFIMYTIESFQFKAKCPPGSYKVSIALLLGLLGIVPGIVYTLSIARKLISDAPPGIALGPPLPTGPVMPPPPSLPLRSRGRRRY